MKKLLKFMFFTILGLVLFLVTGYFLFVNFYPSFGGDVSEARRTTYQISPNFEGEKFLNTNRAIPKDPSLGDLLKVGYKFFFEKVPNGRPESPLPVQELDSAAVASYEAKQTRLFWYGHSAFLLQAGNKNVLIDPMFGEVPAPHPWIGGKRFFEQLPLTIAQLPQIDAVLISHDHYDHLDYESIKQLQTKVAHFFVPLGVGVHLEAWGVPSEKITELDWWEKRAYEDFTFVCTPAQHFSGRKFSNGQHTLWASWVIQTQQDTLFFSGDSGYAEHFKEIGEKYGPFDLAMLECGQYNPMWKEIHMMPEETVQAGQDLGAKQVMPIHWGGFKLAMHSWTDPVERVSKKASELDVPLITPKIGEEIRLGDSAKVYQQWWLLEK